jgi:O-antigen ligase
MVKFDQHSVLAYQSYMLYAIAFFIPLWTQINNGFIVLFVLLGIFSLIKGYSTIKPNAILFLVLGFYVLHVIGLSFSENLPRGLFDLEVKLSFLVFPIGFAGISSIKDDAYRNVLRSFLYGTLAAAVICLSQSAYKVLILDQGYWHFLTSRFSVIVHQSYFAMYLIFALIVHAYLEWPIVNRKQPKKNALNAFVFLFLSVAVVLTGSKIGFIMWISITFGLMIALLKTLKSRWIPIVAMLTIFIVIGVIFSQAPMLQERVLNLVKVAQSDSVDPSAKESTAVRSLVYSSAWEIVTTQDWFGQGTGDFQVKLDEIYHQRNYEKAAEQHLNAHNLFLQTWIAQGIPGLLMILALFFLMFFKSIQSSDYIFLSFSLLFLLISLTESALNMRAGVLFFAFFLMLFSRRQSLLRDVN